MLIPRGNAIHENLATSYVLVDALVDDLCEGGFSGIIEIVLRDADDYVIIDSGKVAAVIEESRSGDQTGVSFARSRTRRSVADTAAQSRRERGRISVYGCSPDTARAIAACIAAEPLYQKLSTDFADLEKMLLKLSREREREWFVDIIAASGMTALVHIKDDRCHIIKSKTGSTADQPDQATYIESSGRLDPAENSALRELLEEGKLSGGVFDVSFKPSGEAAEAQSFDATDEAASRHDEEIAKPLESQTEAEMPPASERYDVDNENEVLSVEEKKYYEEKFAEASVTSTDDLNTHVIEADGDGRRSRFSPDSFGLTAPEAEGADISEAEAMAEVKRLMGEVAYTIERGSQAVEQRDSFPMYLRAGQLKIADRYPFLDPFGAEFEYLAGEIAFIGAASRAEFIAGLTEALRLAVIGVAESSTQPARLRAQVAGDLRQLLEARRSEFERFGLDQSIEQIIGG